MDIKILVIQEINAGVALPATPQFTNGNKKARQLAKGLPRLKRR